MPHAPSHKLRNFPRDFLWGSATSAYQVEGGNSNSDWEVLFSPIPFYITGNGIADADDDQRANYIADHLAAVWRAIQAGADVRGYFYWSLLDNFEWAKGFEPRFGLVEIDYKSQERKVRPSAWVYAKIAKQNHL